MRHFSRPHLYSQLQTLGTQVWSFEVLYSSKAAALACPAAEGRVVFHQTPAPSHPKSDGGCREGGCVCRG